jgi:hypothetical protein
VRFILTLVVVAAISSLCQAAPKAAKERDREGITDIKSLEASVQTAKTELDKARSTALLEWQMNAIYVNAKTDLDTKKTAMDVARKTNVPDQERSAAEAAYSQSKLNFDKLVAELENANDAITKARQAWEEACKNLEDFRRQLSDTSKPIEGVRAIIAALPRDYWPTEGKDWTPLQEKAANKWFSQNLNGKRMHLSGTAGRIDQQRGKGAIIHFQESKVTMGSQTLSSDMSALFPESQVAVVRKIDSGKPVAVDGSIRSIHVRWTKSDISVNVSVGDSTLVSK